MLKMICPIIIFKLFLLLEILQNATNTAMASDISHMEELELKLDLPYNAVDSKYMEGLKNIENKTGVSIKIFVYIKGNFDQIEEAKKRIIDVKYSDKISESSTCEILEKNDQDLLNLINANNLDIQTKLETIVNKSLESDREKGQFEETFRTLQNEINATNINIQGKLEAIENKLQENIEEIKNNTQALKAEDNLGINEIKNDFQKKTSDMQDSLYKEIVDSISDVDLDKFYKSDEYLQFDKFDGDKPIHTASAMGRIDVVKKLIESGTSVDLKNNNSDWTPLHYASLNGHLNIVKYLINANASINAQTDYGETALIRASYSGHKSIVDYLCSKKAKVDIKQNGNLTALDVARGDDKNEIIQILKKYGA